MNESASDRSGACATVTISVEGMSCGGCAAGVQRRLESEGGVESATVELGARRAEVRFDSGAVTASALVDVVRAMGYGAELAGEPRAEGSESGEEARNHGD